MLKTQIPPVKRDYADKFRQNQDNMGAGTSKGAPVAPPCVTKHMIGSSGKPEVRGK
jgi:hypothetical protein